MIRLRRQKFPWRLDDEKLVYPAYERMVKLGVKHVCVHKGLLPAAAEKTNPGITPYGSVDDVGKAAKDWPQLNFIIYHAGFRPFPTPSEEEQRKFEETGYMEWVSELIDIPQKFGVGNVYADVGACFALTCVTHPRYAAGLMGLLIKGLGADKVCWGTDSVFYGSPQWQIEAFRRMEITEDMRKRFGFAPLGAADGPVKTAIFGANAARLYGLDLQKADAQLLTGDRLATLKSQYLAAGIERNNLAYGYVDLG